jgi:hypothetical protein
MLTFIQLLEELSKDYVVLPPPEVERMIDRFGDKTLQMGHLQADGSLAIPVDSIVEAVRTLGNEKLNEAVKSLKSEKVISILESAGTLVERVAEAQKRKLEQMVEKFQSEHDDLKAHKQWKQIEKMIFGVDYSD